MIDPVFVLPVFGRKAGGDKKLAIEGAYILAIGKREVAKTRCKLLTAVPLLLPTHYHRFVLRGSAYTQGVHDACLGFVCHLHAAYLTLACRIYEQRCCLFDLS